LNHQNVLKKLIKGEVEMDKIATALVKAQKEFAPALKTSTNPHFKSKYVDLAGCVEAVIDALNNHGIMLMQKNHPYDGGVSVETIFLHESGESISGGILTVPASKQDPQGYGSALTYARRYSLMAAAGIAPEDDDGNAASNRPTAKKVSAARIQELIDQINQLEGDAKKNAYKFAMNECSQTGDLDAAKQIKEGVSK
jgi:hypothetical protein